ncbi:MAG: nuclear transport factor 2 family protein [Aestuariibacter sp.]
MNKSDQQMIQEIVQHYFEGLYFADVKKLKAIFAPDCILKAPGLRRDLESWFELIASRAVPAQTDQPFDYQILSTDIAQEQAMVKVLCPVLSDIYVDFLGLLKEHNTWKIVNKMYAHANEPENTLCHM